MIIFLKARLPLLLNTKTPLNHLQDHQKGALLLQQNNQLMLNIKFGMNKSPNQLTKSMTP
jgi:hypothetical protein